MVKISDFFKKEDKPQIPKKPAEEKAKDIKPQGPIKEKLPVEKPPEIIPKEEIKKELPSQERPIQEPLTKTHKIMKDSIETFDIEKTKSLYNDCIELSRQVFEKAKKNQAIEASKIEEKVKSLVQQIILGNYDLVNLTNTHTEENYLYAHSVNVCILSILLGQGLGYDKVKLQELGFAAFLHDMGMIKVIDIVQKKGRLNEEEYEKVKSHPSLGVNILGTSRDIVQAAISVVLEHHECSNGMGYPKGLKSQYISEYAKIVATADCYEALTHPRSYRDKFSPYEALKELLKNKERFDYKLLKIIIEKISVYPIGSYVQLSTGEIGVVVKMNRESPLRSVIKIKFDSEGKRLEEEKVVDLMKSPTLYIKRPINEKELNL